jgi:hypothetical protein
MYSSQKLTRKKLARARVSLRLRRKAKRYDRQKSFLKIGTIQVHQQISDKWPILAVRWTDWTELQLRLALTRHHLSLEY